MRTVDQATQTAWSQISYTKVRVYIPELEMSIPDEKVSSIEFSESISDTDNLFFVGCISSGVELTLNDFNTDIHLDSIEVYAQKGTTSELKIFTGKIYTADLDGRNNTMKVVAYDALYRIFNADVTGWYDALSLPMTMKNFRDSFFSHFNITQNTATLINDDFIVNRSIGGEEILGRDIIKPLCEANVVFGHIDHDGKFSYINISNYNRTVALAEVSDMTKSDYVTEGIDKVIVRMDEEDIGAVAGYGANAYIIQGNMFFYGLSAAELQTVADAIFGELEGFTFQPLESEQMYNPIYELGDLITVPDGFGNTYQSIILKRTTDVQREIVSAKGLSEYSQAASYSNTSLISLLGKTNRLHRDIEETRSTITDVERGLQTEIRQTAEGIEIQIADLQSQIDGENAYYERETGAPTLLNYPYWDFTTSIPCNNTIRTAPIYTENMGEDGDQYPHFTYTETDRKNHRSDLVYVDDTNLAYRFVLENGVWYWKEIADSEYTQVLSRLATLEATAEQLTSEYSELSVTLQDGYYTKVQTDSRITQSATQIQTTVSATYATKDTTNSLQSQITQQAGQISAKVDQTGGNNSSFAWYLTPSGFTLMSNNRNVFLCNSSGITINGNGEFSGTIRASWGSIAGWNITPDAITKTQGMNTVSIQSDGTIINKRGNDIKYALQYDGHAVFKDVEIEGYATAATVNALIGNFNTLNAKAITTDNFSAQNINAGQITAGTLNANRIAANSISASKLETSGSGYFNFGSVNVLSPSTTQVRNLYLYDGSTYRQVYLSGGYVRYN